MRGSWLKENIAPLLALLWTLFTFCVLTMILLKEVRTAENITFLIINTVSNIAMIIVGYHFGSSAGSKAKQDVMAKIAENTTTSSETSTTTNSKTSNEGNNSDNNKP